MASPAFTQVRQAVADALTTALGSGWIVFPFAKRLANMPVNTGVVVVSRTKVEAASSGTRMTTIEVHVLDPLTDNSGVTEDALETRLDTVLDALDTSDLQSAFRGAERAMYPVGDSAANSYVITLELLTRK